MNPVHPKVTSSAIGAGIGAGVGGSVGQSLGTVLVWLLSLHGILVPANVGDAFGIIFGALVAGGTAFAAGWMTKDPTT